MPALLPVPIYRQRPWGNAALTAYGRVLPYPDTGESWELSVHPHGLSRTPDGVTLRERYPDLRLCLKLLTSSAPLSVQVHPSSGPDAKTEMWLILDAAPGAFVCAGLKEPYGKDALRERIADGTLADTLRRIPVSSGDVVFLPAGTVHTLGAGLTLAEIQQPGDITYRLFDWGRPRELHVEQGLAVLDVTSQPILAHAAFDRPRQELPSCAWFTAEACVGDFPISGGEYGRAQLVPAVAGVPASADVHTLLFPLDTCSVTADGETVCVPAYTTVFLPHGTSFSFRGGRVYRFTQPIMQ